MDRRFLVSSGLMLAGSQLLGPLARAQDAQPMPPPDRGPDYHAPTYSRDELVNAVSDFFGVTAETAGGVIEHVFKEMAGRPATSPAPRGPAPSPSACATARACSI
jgi:hypothetical protein